MNYPFKEKSTAKASSKFPEKTLAMLQSNVLKSFTVLSPQATPIKGSVLEN
jgi:hypothetical protein